MMNPQHPDFPLQFKSVIYPLWRRQVPALTAPLWRFLNRQFFPVDTDLNPPQDTETMAAYLVDWQIITGIDPVALSQLLADSAPQTILYPAGQKPPVYEGGPIRIPAQWEAMEKVLISWGIIYPGLWEMHAQMAEAISMVADVEILVPNELWARAVYTYLALRKQAKLDAIHFTLIKTNDIWIRDYGPIIGFDPSGQRVASNARYAVLPQYPQADDDGMSEAWASLYQIPVQSINLDTEGGNLWTDGQGTLIMSEQLFYSNRYYDRDRMLAYLHELYDFEKLIITPRLTLEETGHIDLLVKLISPNQLLISEASSRSTATLLRKARAILEAETNAQGQQYEIIPLPTPSLYLNWFTYSIRRAYTNALTVNGRVLVPVFGIREDEQALRVYEQAMPDYEIIPIESAKGSNGGGAVHCMTKEVPRA
ncbi:hypothetical protein MASR2M15_08670 [Anaerolineales bacterium]